MASNKHALLTRSLRITSNRLLPVYVRITNDGTYARQLVSAVNRQNHELATKLIRLVVPSAFVFNSDGGFYVSQSSQGFGITGPHLSIRVPQVRRTSRLLIRLLRRIVKDETYTARLVRLFLLRKEIALSQLIRRVIGKRNVIAVIISENSFIVWLSSGYEIGFELVG